MLSDVATSCGFRVKRLLSKDLLEMQTVAPLTFLYISLRRKGKPLAESWKAAETGTCD